MQSPAELVATLRGWMTEAPGHDRVSGGSAHLDRVPVLSQPEAMVVARLLELLAESSDNTPVTDLAADLAARLYARLGV
ncbi:hypothetical protein [Actinopolymorpha alba]|uniref:hypothetical protein n=1 Tax=Actinopolymorpha alba TaxID=533267 RepID=UPI00037D59CC|nr:hypothetical protein [Actinopolymorpha alba]